MVREISSGHPWVVGPELFQQCFWDLGVDRVRVCVTFWTRLDGAGSMISVAKTDGYL